MMSTKTTTTLAIAALLVLDACDRRTVMPTAAAAPAVPAATSGAASGSAKPAPSASAPPCAGIKGDCPKDTYPDVTSVDSESYSGATAAGAPVKATVTGACRVTCRQMCPSFTVPVVTETTDQSAGTKTRRYTCSAVPDTQYTVRESGGIATGLLVKAHACVVSSHPYAASFCSVKKCGPGWSRASIRVDINGAVYVETGLESDDVFKGVCGTATWSIKDGAGSVIVSGTTKRTCIGGKLGNGKAVSSTSGPMVVTTLSLEQLARVAALNVEADCA